MAKKSKQSELGARAGQLEALLAERGLKIGHCQAMDVLARMDGGRSRQAMPRKAKDDRTSAERLAEAAANALAMQGAEVPAEAHSDDYVFEADFDARDFLARADAAAIAGLIGCGWRGDYPADRVAQSESEDRDDPEVTAVLDYATRKHGMGFECSVDQEAAEAWLMEFRPQVLARAQVLSACHGDAPATDWDPLAVLAGFEVVPAGGGFRWVGPDDLVAPTGTATFGTERDAWESIAMEVASAVMGRSNLSDEEWERTDGAVRIALLDAALAAPGAAA